ncbi:MAG: glycine cleavage system protein GcvH [Propionibacteriaceae bacterium]|nr:glycine cleavage system protein GcvH [Propionibacteriaceae bacterium]
MAEVPTDLCFTKDHEWVRILGAVARVGVTEHAAQMIGDVVYVSLPTVGTAVATGDSCAELESTKSVNDVYAPVAGVVKSVNDAVVDAPETINSSPYGDGWLFEIEMATAEIPSNLLDASAYSDMLASDG